MFWLLCLWQTNPWGPGPVFFIVLSFFILLFNWRKDSISQLRPPGIYELFLRNVLQKLTQGTSKESQLQEGSCPIWLWWSRAAFTGSMSWPHRATAVLQLTGPLTCMWLNAWSELIWIPVWALPLPLYCYPGWTWDFDIHSCGTPHFPRMTLWPTPMRTHDECSK